MTTFSPTTDTLSASILSTSERPEPSGYLREAGLAKRVIDVAGATFGLICFAPLMAIIALLIYRESPGSVIYKQRRVGRNGKIFTILKLRSMKLDSEKDGAGWTVENDPRCLKVGKFIRAWNLDEVPQFWNVLKGDMSLVGPRPERPEHMDKLCDEIRHYNKRLKATPGLTGLAQVNGWRGDTDLNERVRCDIEYIKRGTLWLDLVIIAQTLVSRENAY